MLCESYPLSETNPRVTLSAYVLDDMPPGGGQRRPAVLLLPGGGYTFLHDWELEFLAASFTAEGYHAFILRYSVGEAARVPAPVMDGFRAIAFLRDHAEAWRIDPDKIVVCGFSAGGHLASALMTMWKDVEFAAALGREPEALRPDAGLLCFALTRLPYTLPPTNTGRPAADRQALLDEIQSGFLEPQHPDWAQAVFERDAVLYYDSAAVAMLDCFGTTRPDAELLRRYSTAEHVEADTPPAFVWAATPDDIVPAANSVAFAQAMLRKGRPVELHLFGEGGHGAPLAKTPGEAADDPPAAQWFPLALRWLRTILGAPERAKGSPFSGAEPGRPFSALPEADEKPAQYYENIYYDRDGMFRHTPFSLEQRLAQHVAEGNEEAALETLGRINGQGAKAVLARDPLRSAKNSLICSCTILTRAAIQAGVSDEEAFALSDAAIQHIETLTGVDEVLAYESTLLMQVIRLVKKRKGKSYSTPVRKALHYIDSHLDRTVQLDDIAGFVKVHPNYLSKRFRQETGTTLSGYVLARKIHEASYFVQHSEYSMAEIATLYGFSSQSYFISSFKRVLGVSPGKYRNRSIAADRQK